MIPPDRREEWIIRQARERPAAESDAFLDGACAGDAYASAKGLFIATSSPKTFSLRKMGG
jgi:hypothetical protein